MNKRRSDLVVLAAFLVVAAVLLVLVEDVSLLALGFVATGAAMIVRWRTESRGRRR